jgi:hypothetical protein
MNPNEEQFDDFKVVEKSPEWRMWSPIQLLPKN